MDLGIKNRVAFITGASAGIGLSTAEAFVKEGAKVVICGRNEQKLNDAKNQLKKTTGSEVDAYACDTSNFDQVEKTVNQIIKVYDKIDILINNAGKAQAGGVVDAKPEDWKSMIDVKIYSLINTCKLIAPVMKKNKWGRIVNMSSIGGIYPNPKLTISHGLSAAINNLTKSLSLDLAPYNIIANAIGIGAVRTKNWEENMLPKVRLTRKDLANLDNEVIIKKLGEELTPVGRFGKPIEIAQIACFLCSECNGFVTGSVIEASGGADKFM
tara:strand:- start:568 stop:1374 length:807 start_codon:yes stop_codon:yes gene_type:complete